MFKTNPTLSNPQHIIQNLEREYHFPTIPYFIGMFGSYPFIEKIYYVDIQKLLEILEESGKWELVHQLNSIDPDTDDNDSDSSENKPIENPLYFINGFQVTGGMTMVFKTDDAVIMVSKKVGYEFSRGIYEREKKIVTDIGNAFIYKLDHSTESGEFIKNLICNRRKSNDLVYFIGTSKDGLYLKESKIKPMDLDIDLLYGKELAEKHTKIAESLSDLNQRGIYFFHGDPGTGKSSYIRYLVSCITSRKVIIVSPNFVNEINTPQFVPFLLDNPSSVLVIEDSENIIRGRESEGSPAISNLLNIGDGLMGDCFNMQIICTFNTSRDKIDEALLRKGRLKYEHHFQKLTIENSQKVLDMNNIKYTATTPMSLSDIFNTDDLILSDKIKKEDKHIGFK